MQQLNKEYPFFLTKSAIKRINFLLDKQAKPELCLRVYVTGGGCNGFQYGFKFDENVNQDDTLFVQDKTRVVIDPMSLQYLIHGTLDFVEEIEGSRFVVTNPNATNTCGCGSSFSV